MVYGDNQPAANPLPEENELTVLVDYQKYLKLQANQSQLNLLNKTQCLDSEHEVYQEFGNKCVLACRYSAPASVSLSSKDDCGKNESSGGCFCKAGFVRNGSKCIPVSECPAQKCHIRNEIYVSIS